MTSKRPEPPFPKQKQPMPGLTARMKPLPDHGEDSYKGSGRLCGTSRRFQLTKPRWAAHDTVFADHKFSRGECVAGLLTAANRDPSVLNQKFAPLCACGLIVGAEAFD